MQRSAVVYVRVSSQQQVENFSLSVQEKVCRDFCQREGLKVARVFREEGESAKSADRTQLKEMLAFCSKNKATIGFVVVHSLSRFSRDTRDHLALTGGLLKLSIALRSATEPLSDTPTGRFLEIVMSGQAQLDNEMRAERTGAGMREALKSGRWVFRAPLGYRNGVRGERNQPSLIPDAMAPVVRAAFAEYAPGGVAERDVPRRLAARGLTMPNGKPISAQTINKMLRNALYCGRIILPAWGISAHGDFEPLIDEATFDRVQARIAGRFGPKVPHTREHPDFPLRRFVRCGECENPLTGAWSKGRTGRYAYYECHRCRKLRVSKAQLDGAFVDLVARLQPQPEYMKLFAAIVRDVWKRREGSAREDRARLERRAADARKKLDRIEGLLVDEVLSTTAYERERDRLTEDITVAEMELGQATAEHLEVDAILAFAENVLTDAARLWEHVAPEHRRRLQKAFFPEGLVYEPGPPAGFRTAPTCLAFKELLLSQGSESAMVALRGFEPRSDG